MNKLIICIVVLVMTISQHSAAQTTDQVLALMCEIPDSLTQQFADLLVAGRAKLIVEESLPHGTFGFSVEMVSGERLPVLYVSNEGYELFGAKRNVAKLGLVHEMRHFQQYLRSVREGTFDPGDWAARPDADLTFWEARSNFLVELEAWASASKFALTQNWDCAHPSVDFYRKGGIQLLAEGLSNFYAGQDRYRVIHPIDGKTYRMSSAQMQVWASEYLAQQSHQKGGESK